MYSYKVKLPKTTLKGGVSYYAETIEQKLRRAKIQGEPIDEGIPAIYPEDPETSNASHDIRADKWEIAQSSLTEVGKAKKAKGTGKMSNEGTPGEGKNPSGEKKE